MTDLSALSDDELMAMYTQGAPAASAPRGLRNNNPLNLEATVNWTGMQGNDGRFAVFPDIETGVEAADRNLQTYATKHGLSTVAGVVNRWAPPSENDSRAYAQTVAQKLGVGLDDPLDMSNPQVRRAMLDAMADVENGQDVDLGAAMPTQQAQDLSGMSDDELMALYAQSAPRTPPPRRQVSTVQATPPRRPVAAPAPAREGSDPTIAQDVWSGFTQPFRNLGDTVMAGVRNAGAEVNAPPPNPLQAIQQAGGNLMRTAGLVGDLAGVTSAPIQAAVRPVARGLNRATAELPMAGGSPGFGMAPQLITDPNARQAALEGAINTALSAARPATPRPAMTAPAVKPMSVDQLRAAKGAAYDAVDKLGVAYAPKATARLADDIGYELATKRINPKVTPKAHAVMEDIQAQLKSGAPVSLSQLDDMRQQVWRATGKADDAEQFFGAQIRELIDQFVDTAGPAQVVNGSAPEAAAALANARDLNTRWRKVQEVVDRTESADLRAASTYAGGNKANATRQNLRPLIDPKSGQRIRNLTPAETRALNKTVRGTGSANVARQAGKLLDPRGLLGQVALGPLGIPTKGLTPVLGAMASEASNALTMKSVKDLIDLMSMGGVKPKPIPPISPTLVLGGRPPIPLRSVPGLTGVSEVAAPLTRIPSASEGSRGGRKERPAPRKKRK